MRWCETQASFASALRNANRPVPNAVRHRPNNEPHTARFNVYRNNTIVSLTDALGATFPVVRELVGEDFFAGLARAYIAEHMPQSPILIYYGNDFPAFVEGFRPAASLPFLADVARIEWLWLQAYHAEDCESITAQALQDVLTTSLDTMRLSLHPSLQVVQSDWPAVTIWGAHQTNDLDARKSVLANIEPRRETALILRPQIDVHVELTASEIGDLTLAFLANASLAEAIGQLDETTTNEFGGMLSYLFGLGAVIKLSISDT